jgi:competence protein CoiA
MENTSLHQFFAMDKEGLIRSIEEVPRGLACCCTCPGCGVPLIARQGSSRGWHFAHTVDADCKGGMETALHLAAKQLLLKNDGFTVPSITIKREVRLPDGRRGSGVAFRPERWVRFLTVEAEKNLGTIRPDITAILETGPLAIEIAVTHFVESEKRSTLVNNNVDSLEIDLSGEECRKWTWKILTDYVIKNTHLKKWIHAADEVTLHDEAVQAATQDALLQCIPVVQSLMVTIAPVIRTRFWINSRMVDTIERSFGIAVWSPYDPEVNALIKPIVRRLGGSWQPRFKNWLFPLDAKVWLFQELTNLSTRPSERRT